MGRRNEEDLGKSNKLGNKQLNVYVRDHDIN